MYRMLQVWCEMFLTQLNLNSYSQKKVAALELKEKWGGGVGSVIVLKGRIKPKN